jgi:hypothetical protein
VHLQQGGLFIYPVAGDAEAGYGLGDGSRSASLIVVNCVVVFPHVGIGIYRLGLIVGGERERKGGLEGDDLGDMIGPDNHARYVKCRRTVREAQARLTGELMRGSYQ